MPGGVTGNAREGLPMSTQRSFATHGRRPLPASTPAFCRIPCLILCLAYVERVGQCRAPNAPYGLHGRMALVIDIRRFALRSPMSWKMDGAFGELVAGMVNAEVVIAEARPVVAAPAIGVNDGARVDPAADDALEGELRAVGTISV